jgi:hypothetical protein
MARKRAPGAGRKPEGPFKGKSATFTTRITQDTREALELAAEKSGRSISQVAENYLRAALKKPAGEPRNRALADLVELVAEDVEEATGRSWLEDSFTCQALRLSIEALVLHFAPDPTAGFPVPPAIEARATKMSAEIGETFRRPTGFAQILAYHLIARLEQSVSESLPDEWSMPLWPEDRPKLLRMAARDLNIRKDRGGRR